MKKASRAKTKGITFHDLHGFSRDSKSFHIQHLYREIPVDPQAMWMWTDTRSQDYRLERARMALARRLDQLARRSFTPKQLIVYRHMQTGKWNQTTLGVELAVNQSTIYKTIWGGPILSKSDPRYNARHYGGYINKLKKRAAKDWVCGRLLRIIGNL